MEDLIKEIESVIEKELPLFSHSVSKYKILGDEMIKIVISMNDFNGKRVQPVSLSLDTVSLELCPQVFGGMGGNLIYRIPDRENPKEKYLAMKGEKIPFRTPQKNKEAVIKALVKFCQNYKAKLIEFKDVLMYQNEVDYLKYFL